MTMTREEVEHLLKTAGPGPWDVDGPVWNRTVWRSSENRVCFMAHSNGLNDDRDMATSRLVAAAPDLARALLATMTELEQVKGERDALKVPINRLVVVLDRNERKGPIPDIEMMFCWMAAQDVRAALAKITGVNA